LSKSNGIFFVPTDLLKLLLFLMSKLKLAIQKSGRLSESSIDLLKECGIKFPNGGGKLIAEATNFPIELLFLRDDDIPQYVEQQVADIGIVGENVVLESQKRISIVDYLGFSTCKLSIAIPKEAMYSELDYFEGKRLATSYPNILSDFLEKNKINADIEIISGSVEIAPGIGLADGICDIVSSGSTLLSNGLKEVQKVMDSQAVLVAHSSLDSEKNKILQQLLFRMQSVRKAKEYKYILLNAPNEKISKIIRLLPGMNSPTILPLVKSNWSSLHSVIKEEQFWEVIEALKSAGAEGILIVPIEKMIL
jgi:ATP phosphoribosyltransferase